MSIRKFELLIAYIIILLAFANFIPEYYAIRIAGQNILNIRVWVFLFFLVSIFFDPSSMFTPTMRWVYIYIGIYLLFEYLGHYDLWGLGRRSRFAWMRDQHLPLAISVLLIEKYSNPSRRDDLKKIINFSYLVIFTLCITSIIIIYRNPGVVRGAEEQISYEQLYQIRKFGLGEYTFFSSLPFLIPLLVYQYKIKLAESKKIPFINILPIIIITLCSYMAVIVAPFLILIIVLSLAILGRRRLKSNVVILCIILGLFFVTPKRIIGNIFYGFSDIVPNRELSTKLNEIGIAFTEGIELVTYEYEASTGIEGRAARIKYNLLDFVKSPIIGTGKQGNAHLFWLNMLAQFGLMGIFPLIYIIWLQIKKNAKSLSEDILFTYYLSMASFIVLGLLKAMGGYPIYLITFFIIPGKIILLQSKDKIVIS
jgi:hypothetical protein